ncbi:hypothetical protein PHMEG_00038710, partial [Phytophthora megakarya]
RWGIAILCSAPRLHIREQLTATAELQLRQPEEWTKDDRWEINRPGLIRGMLKGDPEIPGQNCFSNRKITAPIGSQEKESELEQQESGYRRGTVTMNWYPGHTQICTHFHGGYLVQWEMQE